MLGARAERALRLPAGRQRLGVACRRTGGLRFPICRSSLYDVVFPATAGDVVLQSDIACDFPLPEPPAGRTLDLDRVSVSIGHSGGGASTLLGRSITVR